jgi:hypothetical protein
MEITIVDAAGNRSESVSAPESVPSGRITAKLVELMGLPAVGPEGRPLAYKLHHKRSGSQLGEQVSLADAGVQDGDVLRLVAEITAG